MVPSPFQPSTDSTRIPDSAGTSLPMPRISGSHSCITQLQAQGPSRTCDESKEEESEEEEENSCPSQPIVIRGAATPFPSFSSLHLFFAPHSLQPSTPLSTTPLATTPLPQLHELGFSLQPWDVGFSPTHTGWTGEGFIEPRRFARMEGSKCAREEITVRQPRKPFWSVFAR